MSETELFRVIETDGMTGVERDLDNMSTRPWTPTFTREQAEACIAWRRANITSRYGYRIEQVPPTRLDSDGTFTEDDQGNWHEVQT